MKRIGKFLIYSRYLILIAVVGCIAITFGAIVMGFGRVVIGFQNHFLKLDFSAKAGKTFSIKAIEVIDIFLVGTVAYIAAVGLYKLFINRDFKLPGLLHISNLNELESKIIGVIIAALAVSFLGFAADDEPKDILNIEVDHDGKISINGQHVYKMVKSSGI